MINWRSQWVKVMVCALGLFLGISGAATAQDKASAGTAEAFSMEDAYVLGPGDLISVFVWRQPTVSRSVIVGPDGRISYPLIGEIRASGRTLPDLQKTIARKMAVHLREPQITVTLEEAASYRIYVLGEVTKPGVFKLTGPVTVVQAVAMAGGFTAFASPGNILVHNPYLEGGQRYNFDYERFADNADSTSGAEGSVLRCLPASQSAALGNSGSTELPTFCKQSGLLRPGDIIVVK